MAASHSSVRAAIYPPTFDLGAMDWVANTTAIVSGGFAVVQPGSQLSINAVEGFPLEDFSADVSHLIPRQTMPI